MRREIVLDTETTGLSPKDGHRIIEIACVEVEEDMPTGRHFHVYIDPERAIDAEAERVHGISNAFLTGKPKFADVEIVDAFLDFVGEATLVAHNAGFERDVWNLGVRRKHCPHPTSGCGASPRCPSCINRAKVGATTRPPRC